MHELANAAASAFGSIDVWVNNAGTSMWGPFEEIPLESQARLIELNLLGAINGSHAMLAHFFDRGGRSVIINVSSIGGLVPMPFAASYSASKFGLAGFIETLRSEFAARLEIEVRGVYPAYVDTPTYLESANCTGRSLWPVPPVVPPERVAADHGSCAPAAAGRAHWRPAHLSRPVRACPRHDRAPGGPTGQALLAAFWAAAAATDGGLFGTLPTNAAVVRGGWGIPERRQAKRVVTVGVALAGLAGASVVLLSRARRAGAWR